ncbi:MAG: hypothetical protein DI568_14935 [Sphingomonas sp.]|nr:MAG: hypothetical protein DI568_14935 [Sphingomonas sp.]
MPIHLYFGPPGSGKTYELVNRVMVEAVKAGRIVYHNIPGIDPIRWAEEFGCAEDALRFVDDDWFVNDQNFPESDEEFVQEFGVIRGGELIVCDEASTIVPRGTGRNSRVTARLDAFFRKHRHFTGDVIDLEGVRSRIAVDIYFASQDAASLHSTVRELAALRIDFQPLRNIFGKGCYKATVYQSHRATKANRIKDPIVRRTNPKGYARYHSFAGGIAGDTAVTESSGNYWTPKMLIGLSIIPITLCVGIYLLVSSAPSISKRFISPQSKRSENTQVASAATDSGACKTHLLDLEQKRYWSGAEWKPAQVVGDRWYLGSCYLERPRGGT